MQLLTLQTEVQNRDGTALSRKAVVGAGEVVAVYRIPGGRSITVDVEPGAGATATVFTTLESDLDTLLAGDETSPWLREWPYGGAVAPQTHTFHGTAEAVVCHSVGGETVLRVRC